ncbi:unnamed protein product [Linum trigynum]
MATVLISSLIVTMINVGGALDPLCGASNEWFCSPTDFNIPDAQDHLLRKLTVTINCDEARYRNSPLVAYVHTSCAIANGGTCGDCLRRATQIMSENCPGKDGAQYGNEECCARYELNNFC